MKVLVTGGAGFIGSHLSQALLDRDCRVLVLDNFDDFYDPAVKHSNLQHCLTNSSFKLIRGDIRDLSVLESLFTNGQIDIIVHLAARAGVRPSIADPIGYYDVNVTGTVSLLEAARKFQVPKFIFGSSSSVYGNNKKIPFAESDNVDFPISPYAASKKAGELLCHTYHHLFGMDITCLRFFTVYGSRQRPDLAIHKFTKLIEAAQPIPVFGDGSMSRDFTYIDDIIAGILAAVERCAGFSTYNLGESQPIGLNTLIAAIENALGKKALIDRKPLQPGDVQRTFADITLAQTQLNYNPSTDLAQGLQEFVAWFRDGG